MPTTQAQTHDPDLTQVKDDHGVWTIGYRIVCACGWESTRHDRPGLATRAYQQHLADTGPRPKETGH